MATESVSVRMEEDVRDILRSKLYGPIVEVVDAALREYFESRDKRAAEHKAEREDAEWREAIDKVAARKKDEQKEAAILDAHPAECSEVKP